MYILASDYDGTLNRGGSVAAEDLAAIAGWRKAGNLFGVISGRSYPNIREELRLHRVPYDFLIGNNGSVIYDGGPEPASMITADGAVLSPLLQMIIEANGWHAAISLAHERYFVRLGNGREQNPREHWIDPADMKRIPAFCQIDTEFGGEEQAHAFAQKVNDRLGQAVTAYPNFRSVDIVPAGVNKATGLLRYIKLKNVTKERTLTVGDNFNDLCMILEFGGYAMATGNPDVIAQAKKSCGSIAELIESQTAAMV